MTARALLLFNPLAGGVVSVGNPRRVSDCLADVGIDAEQVRVQNGFELDPGRLSKKDLIIVHGGDGTLHRLLPQLLGAGLPVGLIPGGTANVLAREIGIPNRIEEAARILSRGRVEQMHLGQADGKPFLLMAGMGADGYLLLKVPDSLKRFLGIAAFWLAGAVRFWEYDLSPFQVHTREEQFDATLAIVSNGRYYGRHLLLAPNASVFEPNLDLVLFQSPNHLRFLRYLWATLFGRHLSLEDVVYRKLTHARAESGTETHVQVDGEPAGVLPRSFSLAPDRLSLVVP
jgi:YegS/Rv2252/BmrU family lipid kinase